MSMMTASGFSTMGASGRPRACAKRCSAAIISDTRQRVLGNVTVRSVPTVAESHWASVIKFSITPVGTDASRGTEPGLKNDAALEQVLDEHRREFVSPRRAIPARETVIPSPPSNHALQPN